MQRMTMKGESSLLFPRKGCIASAKFSLVESSILSVLAEELEKMTVKLEIKGGEGGKTFGSVSSKEIAKGVADQYGKEIDKKKIQLSEAIKTEGTHEVTVKLHPKVAAKLKVHVTAV